MIRRVLSSIYFRAIVLAALSASLLWYGHYLGQQSVTVQHVYGAATPLPAPGAAGSPVISTGLGTTPTFNVGLDLSNPASVRNALSQTSGGTGQTSASNIPLGGDLGGTVGAGSVNAIRGAPVVAGTPAYNDLLTYMPSSASWAALPTATPITQIGGYLGGFTGSNYVTQTNAGPQSGNGTMLVLDTWIGNIDGNDKILWGNSEGSYGSGKGWAFDVAASNALDIVFENGSICTTGITLGIGYHVIVASMTSGTMSTSVDGATPGTCSMTYVVTDASAVHRFGVSNSAAIPATGEGVLHAKAYSRAAGSNAEMQAMSSQGAANRWLLPVATGGDSAVVFDYAPYRDGILTPKIGSAFTQVGTPSVTTILDHTTLTQSLPFGDTDISVVPAPNTDGTVNRHAGGARLRFAAATANEIIGITAQSSNVAVNGVGYNSAIGVWVNGVYQASVQLQSGNRETHDVALTNPAGATVDIVEGPQGLSSGVVIGTYLQAVRAPMLGGMTARGPPIAANRLVVYGDSIAAGQAATILTEQGWAYLLRTYDWPGSVTIDAIGSRGLFTDYTSGGNSVNTLAAQLVAGAQDVAVGGSKVIWLAIGTNDYGLSMWAASSFQTQYAALVAAIHTLDPSIVIYAQTPIPRTVETANGFSNTTTQYRTAIATAVSGLSYVILVDGTALLTTGDLSGDGLHPSLAGHQKYREGVAAKLGIFTPRTLGSTQVAAWYRADQGFTGAAWADLSGNGNTLSQATVANQPTVVPWVKGLPAIAFASTSTQYMQTAAFGSALTTGAIWCVMDQTDLATSEIAFDGITSGNRWVVNPVEGLTGSLNLFAGTNLAYSFGVDTGIPHAYTYVYNTTSSAIYRDNVSLVTGSAGSNTLTGLTVGARFASAFVPLGGHIADAVLLSVVPTTAQASYLQAYAQRRYGVPLPTTGDIGPGGIVLSVGNNQFGANWTAFGPELFQNQPSAPAANANGPIVFAQGGALKVIGTSGTITTLAPP